MKALVTGGLEEVDDRVITSLLREGKEVVIVHHICQKKKINFHGKVKVCYADCRRFEEVYKVFQEELPSIVYWAGKNNPSSAGSAGPGEKKTAAGDESINFLKACLQSNVQKVVFS